DGSEFHRFRARGARSRSRRAKHRAARTPVVVTPIRRTSVVEEQSIGRRDVDSSRRHYSPTVTTPIAGHGPDLLIRGGTVVTADGSRRADVAVRNGSIEAVDADLGELAAGS